MVNHTEDTLRASHAELLARLKDVAGDGICMRGFTEEFRHQIRVAIRRAEGAPIKLTGFAGGYGQRAHE